MDDWINNLEVYNSIFNVTEEKNKFEFYIYLDEKAGVISYEKVRDEIERDLDISDITATHLRDENIGPIINKEYREQVTRRMEDVGFMDILAGCPSSVFENFEHYLRTDVDLLGDDIRLVLDK